MDNKRKARVKVARAPKKQAKKRAGKKASPKKGPATNLHIAIVLDRSGSMGVVRDETILSFNEQVQTIRKNAKKRKGETSVSLVLFNDEIKWVKKMEAADKMKEIDRRHYRPCGTTAMLDAVGGTIGYLAASADDTEKPDYLVIIISDGMENDSQEFTYEDVAEMIQKKQKTERWTFSYIGANQDLSELSDRLHIPKRNMARYSSDHVGTLVMSSRLSSSLSNYMCESMKSDGFISDEDEIEEFSERS